MLERLPYLVKLARVNIAKARMRTILTFGIITFAMLLFIILDGMLVGFSRLSMDNVVGFKTGHIKILADGYDDTMPYSTAHLIETPETVETVLDDAEFVAGHTRRLVFSGEIDNGMDALSIIVFGIDPDTDGRVFKIDAYTREGGLEPQGCLLGANLAADMQLGTGDLVYLTFRDTEGAFVSLGLLVTGIVESLNPAVNASSVFIHLDEAAGALRTNGVSEISIRTDAMHRADAYMQTLQERLPGTFTLQGWREMAADVLAAIEIDTYGMYFFVVFIAVIGMVGIINTMLMSVYEKTREIGTLKALGMTDGEVKALFVIEGMMIGVVGGLAGLAIGALGNWYFVVHGVDITALVGERVDMDIGYRVMGVIRSGWNLAAMVWAFALCVTASALASLYPAAKATKMQPVDCLRVGQ